MTPTFLRSLLFVPATSAPSRLDRLLADRGTAQLPDAVIVDLEDSVPEPMKVAARETLHTALMCAQRLAESGTGVYVRINARTTPYFADDVSAVASWATRGVGVMISKCAGSEDVAAVKEMSTALSGGAIIPLIETLEGFRNRDAVMGYGATLGVQHVAFGAGDMSLDLGIERDYQLALLQHVIMSLVVSAKMHQLRLIDAPSRVIPSTQSARGWQMLLEEECRWSYANGLSGKLAVHPEQIAIIHGVFDHGAKLEWAKQVVADFANAPGKRSVVSSVTGGYMGTPTLKQAQAILAQTAPQPEPGDFQA